MRYVANIEIDVPGFEDVAEFELEIDGDVDQDMGDLYVSDWWIEEINGIDADTNPELEKAVRACLDDMLIENLLIEHYYGG